MTVNGSPTVSILNRDVDGLYTVSIMLMIAAHLLGKVNS